MNWRESQNVGHRVMQYTYTRAHTHKNNIFQSIYYTTHDIIILLYIRKFLFISISVTLSPPQRVSLATTDCPIYKHTYTQTSQLQSIRVRLLADEGSMPPRGITIITSVRTHTRHEYNIIYYSVCVSYA